MLTTTHSGATTAGPEFFTSEQIELAKAKGVKIEKSYSYTMNSEYMANVCPHCNSFVGQFYLFSQFRSLADQGHYKSEFIKAGFHCNDCEIEF